jgi:hypothetical protein
MQFSEIFSTPFLLSIVIIIILFISTFAYVTYKITEQDHKINSMMGLVTTMAEETQYFRNKISTIQSQLSSAPVDTSNVGGTKHIELIAVSDDEDDDSEVSADEDSEDEDSEDEDSEDEDDDDSEDDDNENDDISISSVVDFSNEDNKDIKIINIPLDIISNNIAEIDMDEFNGDNTIIESSEDNTFLKTNVNLNGDLEIIGDSHKTDYKKLTINKLKEIVVSKGITNEVSKLKKNDLLKLLEDE